MLTFYFFSKMYPCILPTNNYIYITLGGGVGGTVLTISNDFFTFTNLFFNLPSPNRSHVRCSIWNSSLNIYALLFQTSYFIRLRLAACVSCLQGSWSRAAWKRLVCELEKRGRTPVWVNNTSTLGDSVCGGGGGIYSLTSATTVSIFKQINKKTITSSVTKTISHSNEPRAAWILCLRRQNNKNTLWYVTSIQMKVSYFRSNRSNKTVTAKSGGRCRIGSFWQFSYPYIM